MTARSRIAQVGFPAAVVAVIAMLVVPLPPFLLDLFLTVNVALGVLLLLATMNVKRALDLAAFPSILLIATLFRLALNVSSTRLILLHAHAGNVIQSFGNFVIGGSVVVGLVIFLILAVIQFVVITNGATRVAEVGARFTLDAMPGKQMAIDADLNAGLIDEGEARRRREDIAAEADFYGAMDGASKFVKGDAIAAVIITSINLVGGLIIGVAQKGMGIGEAAETYSLLTVGDGLISMVPALLVSISSGIIVTRAASDGDLGSDVLGQFARQGAALRVGGGALAALAAVPGLPKLPFLVVGLSTYLLGRRLVARQLVAAPPAATVEPDEGPLPDAGERLAREMRVEPLELELSFDLVELVDGSTGGDLLERVRALRRKLALELGVVIPTIRTRDNLELPPHTYVVRVHGVELGRGEVRPGAVLVIADDLGPLPGELVREPVFGLPAKWVPLEFKAQAELLGAAVVTGAAVITTHLAEVCRRHAGRLLGRTDVKALVDSVQQSDPAVIEELSSAQVSLGEVQRVLQALLEEQVAVRDIVRILEVLGERGRTTKDTETLVEAVRGALGPAISASYAVDGRLVVVGVDPMVEQHLLMSLRPGEGGTFLAIDPGMADALAKAVLTQVQQAEQRGEQPVLVCAPQIRAALRRLVGPMAPTLAVLSYAEIGPQLQVETVGVADVAAATV